MKCEDVIRRLDLPDAHPAPAGQADHLARCPRCAEHARRADRLDRIWEATRPPAPSARGLDALWAQAAAALEAPGPASIPFEVPARRRRWAVAALVAAQAAAALVAASLLLPRDDDPTSLAAAPLPAKVNVGVDEFAVVRIDDDGHRVELLDDSGQFAYPSMAEATQHDLFNALESMASQ